MPISELFRYSARIRSFHLDPQSALSYICGEACASTLETILSRAGLSKIEQSDVFSSLRFCLAPDCPIHTVCSRRFSRSCRGPIFCMQYMDAHSRGAFLILRISQAGRTLRRVGRRARRQRMGRSMQKTLGRRPSIFGGEKAVWRDITGVCMNCLPERTLPCITAFILIRIIFCGERFFFNNCLFEAVLTAPHGMTLSYRAADGTYTPVYAPFSQDRKPFLLKDRKISDAVYPPCLPLRPKSPDFTAIF